MTEMWDDVSEQVRTDWEADAAPFERVYEIIEQTHDGRSTAEIARRALVSESAVRRHYKSLVNTGFAKTKQDGQTTLHRRNNDRVLASRICELREEVTRSELLDSIQEIRAEVQHYRDRYDVVLPKGLAQQLDTSETGGWNDPTTWWTTQQNLAVAQAALAYDKVSRQLAV